MESGLGCLRCLSGTVSRMPKLPRERVHRVGLAVQDVHGAEDSLKAGLKARADRPLLAINFLDQELVLLVVDGEASWGSMALMSRMPP